MASSAAAFGALSAPAAAPAYTCTPVSECRPCPADHLAYPYCRPYNNRQAVRCVPTNGTAPVMHGWSACGKFIGAEVRGYGQFVFLNLVVVAAALSVYIWRQVYQTRKFRGMLYKRVHGRARVRPAL
ncbi:hypothetical protein MOBT1_002513 [Malassezia obtusa]|uniref:Uncharacterized protein n=1 Tax=Malassezia obtusa TaxID=76774 RepID=A0AAF0E032_9BASI|nr:hypothetical protein MOBT1_002513 [Malassezia obtusa]